jgi:hypothetical protein
MPQVQVLLHELHNEPGAKLLEARPVCVGQHDVSRVFLKVNYIYLYMFRALKTESIMLHKCLNTKTIGTTNNEKNVAYSASH